MNFSQFFWVAESTVVLGRSLRFRGAQHLEYPGFSTRISTIYLDSFWVKRSTLSVTQTITSTESGTNPGDNSFTSSDNFTGRSIQGARDSNNVFRDTSAWYHLCYRTTGSSANSAGILWVNGIEINTNMTFSTRTAENISYALGKRLGTSQPYFFNGYVAEFHRILGDDGDDPVGTISQNDFGEFNAEGIWVPKEYTGSHGPKGVYFDFSDPADIGADRSGNGNNWTPNGFELTSASSPDYDWVLDGPPNNYATINPLYRNAAPSNGNLTTPDIIGKPSILPGTAKNVLVNGLSTSWDGTEAGWTYTGDLDFGQRDGTVNDTTAKGLPDALISKPTDHFEAILDSGANILTTAQAKFPNGLWWIKSYSNSNQHQLMDSVRGGTDAVRAPATSIATYSAPGGNAVAWSWGTDASGLNVTAGFQIITYTGDGVAGRTVPHGLGVAPDCIFIFRSDGTANVTSVYHSSLGSGNVLNLKTNDGAQSTTAWNNTDPTATEFTLGDGQSVNVATEQYVAYLWRSVPGYSAFGSYVGNGNSNGPFVYTGFTPAFMVRKSEPSGSWGLHDNKRDPYNVTRKRLQTNSTGSESNNWDLDLVSNGFKMRNSGSNQNGDTYVYMTWAQAPFGGANVAPATAR